MKTVTSKRKRRYIYYIVLYGTMVYKYTKLKNMLIINVNNYLCKTLVYNIRQLYIYSKIVPDFERFMYTFITVIKVNNYTLQISTDFTHLFSIYFLNWSNGWDE